MRLPTLGAFGRIVDRQDAATFERLAGETRVDACAVPELGGRRHVESREEIIECLAIESPKVASSVVAAAA